MRTCPSRRGSRSGVRSQIGRELLQVALARLCGEQAGLREVDHVGSVATLETDVDLGLELVGAFPLDLDAGAVDQRLVGADVVGDRLVGVAVAHGREHADGLALVLLLTLDLAIQDRFRCVTAGGCGVTAGGGVVRRRRVVVAACGHQERHCDRGDREALVLHWYPPLDIWDHDGLRRSWKWCGISLESSEVYHNTSCSP